MQTEPHPCDLDGTNKFRAAAAAVRAMQFDLDMLAAAFDDTGNAKMADKLATLADNCERVNSLIKEALNDSVNVMMQRTNESSHNILMAAFAVAGINLEKEKG